MKHLPIHITLFATALIFLTTVLYSSESGKIVPSRSSFSPNSDGILDSVYFSVSDPEREFENLHGWEIEIVGRTGRFVRRFQSDLRLIRPNRAISNLFMPGPLDTMPVEIFSDLEWDGRDDGGNFVPDGIYTIRASIRPSDGTIRSLPEVEITVDTVAPELSARCMERVILRQRGEDGKLSAPLSAASIEQRGSPGDHVEFIGSVLGEDGSEVEKRIWETRLPEKIVWNGKRSDGLYAPPGRYSYRLIARDPAGNSLSVFAHSIWIVTETPPFILECDECLVSPAIGSGNDQLNLRIVPASFKSDLLKRKWEWNLRILSEDFKTEVDSLTGLGPSERIRWPVARLPEKSREGLYHAVLSLNLDGNRLESPPVTFRSDGTPPSISVAQRSEDPTPDGDGENERLRLQMEITDPSGISSYSLSIINQPNGDLPTEKIFRTLSGTEVPERFEWNGRGDDGDITESFERYRIELTAVDRAGNRIRKKLLNFRSGLIIRPVTSTGERLVSRIPVQRYFEPDGSLTEETRRLLSVLRNTLTRYGHYRMEIEVHSSIPGREEENLRITEFRANRIFRDCIEGGLKADRLRYRGLGETEPNHPDETNGFERYRNERIEIHLIQKR